MTEETRRVEETHTVTETEEQKPTEEGERDMVEGDAEELSDDRKAE